MATDTAESFAFDAAADLATHKTVDVTDIDEDLIVAQHGPFTMTPTGIVVTSDPTLDEWNAATTWAQRTEKASPWWVADLIEYGERVFGEKYSQALDCTDYTEQALKDITYVARNVAPSRRRHDVSFSHHREVAALPPTKQDEWLHRAWDKGLTVQALRHQIKVAKAQESGQLIELWVLVKCTDLDDQQKLAEQMKLEGRAVQFRKMEL
jgi:hypothetical protein